MYLTIININCLKKKTRHNLLFSQKLSSARSKGEQFVPELTCTRARLSENVLQQPVHPFVKEDTAEEGNLRHKLDVSTRHTLTCSFTWVI